MAWGGIFLFRSRKADKKHHTDFWAEGEVCCRCEIGLKWPARSLELLKIEVLFYYSNQEDRIRVPLSTAGLSNRCLR